MKKQGRPLRYKTPQDLQKVIDKYFRKTDEKKVTVSGLALDVGGKQLLDDYQRRDGYSSIVKEAKLRIEMAYELDLRAKGRSGDIFALKNFGWRDKQEIEHSGDLSIKEMLGKGDSD